ncbi:hypothetical protein Aglo03_11490 [Actinokineospora globicatena]|uniref:Uncharacterized protein n=1 Tax=Actinokineospora globicatena TaxID=103729 RepID=A0A9W6V8W0_9PSEU|nr:hypothetical protein Aglo03_11490 [Actinokineospora globicatena]
MADNASSALPGTPGWQNWVPRLVASRTAVQGWGGRGDAKRNGPTGGWAYGTPRNSATPPRRVPRTAPAEVRTTTGAADDSPVVEAAVVETAVVEAALGEKAVAETAVGDAEVGTTEFLLGAGNRVAVSFTRKG